MNKGNLNKLVTNYPVELTEEEISNLSGTLAPVIAACGGGGGGTGGKIYTGIGFVNVNNTTNQIGLTNEANTKLNQDIPTKVSDLSDSANYQTIAGMDEYLTTGAAQNTYLSKSDAESDYAPIGTYTDVQTLKNQIQNVYTKSETSASDELSAEFDSLSAKYQEKGSYASQQSVQTLTLQVQNKQDKLTFGYDENNAISSIDGTPLAGQGGTTYSAGQYINIDANDTISVTGVLALDEYAQYEPVLMGDSNITATSSKIDNHTQWNLAINSTPVVTDTKLVGENSITAHTTQTSGEWLVGLEQTAHNAIASIDGISTDVGTLKAASANWNEVSAKLDTTAFSTVSGTFLTTIPDTYATKEYANNASANALSEAETWVEQQGYLTSVPDTYALKTDIPTTVAQLTDSANYYKKSETSGSTELSTEFGKYALKSEIPTVPTKVSDLTDSANYYKTTETSSKNELSTEFAKYLTTAQYNTDSATFALKSDLNGLVNSASVTTNDNYVMTNTGWKVLTLPGGGMTQVYHDTTLTGDGNANDNQLGVAWSALSGNTIDSAKSAGSAASAYIAQYYYKESFEPQNIAAAIDSIDNANTQLIADVYSYPEYLPRENPIYADYALSAYINENTISSFSDYSNAINAKLDTTAFSTVSSTFLTKSSADNDYAPISITATVNTLTAASAGWNNKVDKPTSLNDKYLVLRTDSNGAVSGWCDFQDQSYSKSAALGTFVATANIDSTTLSGDGKSVSTKLGVKTDVIATIDYVSGNYLPTSGGTVSGQLVISGGSNFDQQFLKITRENVNGHARLGLGQYGALALKTDDNNSHTTQINISPNTTNDQLVQVQHNGNQVGYLIPAVTANTTAGLTNDGILHIILES